MGEWDGKGGTQLRNRFEAEAWVRFAGAALGYLLGEGSDAPGRAARAADGLLEELRARRCWPGAGKDEPEAAQ
jgi:hypothetical protein